MTETQLYRHFGKDGELLYVGISISAMARLGQHKDDASWFSDIRRVDIETFPTREDALTAERAAIQDENPKHNIKHKRKHTPYPPLPTKPATRRGSGEGSMDERGENQWRLRYRADGKRQAVTFCGTKTDARRELRRLLTIRDDATPSLSAQARLHTHRVSAYPSD
jgi:hypothetical protein